jgi:hypothetical protein
VFSLVALTTVRRSVATSRRLHLATLPKALALLAAAETLRCPPEAAEAAEALALDPTDTEPPTCMAAGTWR